MKISAAHSLIIFLISVLSAVSKTSVAQCPTTPIYINTQADINNFQVNFPGCSILSNRLIIDGGGIVNLNGLSSLQESSSLISIRNTSLIDLVGLDNLSKVNYLRLESNNSLNNLIGLDNLEDLYNIYLLNNPNLNSVASLSNLTSIIQEILIELNPSLSSLIGLSGSAIVGPGSSCETINISSNDLLTNLIGLPNVEQINRNLIVTQNDGLIDLSGLSNLRRIERFFWVEENAMLTSFTGVNNLEYCYELTVHNNLILPNLQGLNNLTTISNILKITENSAIQNLNGINNLNSVSDIWVRNNASSLTSLMGLENINTANKIFVENNDGIVSIAGFDGLNTVTDFLLIEKNDVLSDLSGLENLQSISFLGIIDNNALLHVDALSQLSTVSKGMLIQDNAILNSVMGLSAFNSVPTQKVIIKNNSLLNLCHADGICFLIENHSTLIDISNNAGTCYDITDVAVQCGCTPILYYEDNDGDGYGAADMPHLICRGNPMPAGHVTNDDDCDDANPNDFNLVVNNPINRYFYGANYSLSSAGTVSYGFADRIFQAGNNIVLEPGFEVISSGTVFVAQIGTCGQ